MSCPICGSKGSIARIRHGDRVYYVYKHYIGRKNKTSRYRYCYLGREGIYEHVEGLLNLGLSGLISFDHKAVLRRLIKKMAIDNVRLSRKELDEIISMLKTLAVDSYNSS